MRNLQIQCLEGAKEEWHCPVLKICFVSTFINLAQILHHWMVSFVWIVWDLKADSSCLNKAQFLPTQHMNAVVFGGSLISKLGLGGEGSVHFPFNILSILLAAELWRLPQAWPPERLLQEAAVHWRSSLGHGGSSGPTVPSDPAVLSNVPWGQKHRVPVSGVAGDFVALCGLVLVSHLFLFLPFFLPGPS